MQKLIDFLNWDFAPCQRAMLESMYLYENESHKIHSYNIKCHCSISDVSCEFTINKYVKQFLFPFKIPQIINEDNFNMIFWICHGIQNGCRENCKYKKIKNLKESYRKEEK